MGYLSRDVSGVGGRRVLLALGGLYVAVAVGSPVLHVVEGKAFGEVLIIAILVGSAGIGLLYYGYRLPRTDIRPDLFSVVAGWCVRAIGVMVGILLLVEVVAGMDDPVSTGLVLPPLASVAGLGMGVHDARAKTRALDAEERRREVERYETIVETVNDGIYVVDEDKRFTLVNDAYAEMVGYDREELLGSHTSLVATEDAVKLGDEIQRDLAAGDGGTDTYEATLETASGGTVEAEATFALLPDEDDGEPDRVGVVRDVTERNERERRLERQNERLDRFAGMLAHELRNPVTIGQIYSQQLPAEASPEAVDYVTEAFDRIEDMIDVMLLVARGREAISERTQIQLADAVRDAWNEVDAPNATLEVTVDRTIEADETYVRHLFRNLFENAIEHGGGDVTVTVGELPTGFYVADDGAGIPSGDRKTVFEPGYTTATGHGGMGLGLTFVREMAEVYGWTCSATESAAGGARFEFENLTKPRSVTE